MFPRCSKIHWVVLFKVRLWCLVVEIVIHSVLFGIITQEYFFRKKLTKEILI